MAGSKSDRVLNARYDIFASNQNDNDSVRVGYIDSKRGYISGLSVYEANRYAEKNPGTQFIIATREEVRYLNITEVNKLTNQISFCQVLSTHHLLIMQIKTAPALGTVSYRSNYGLINSQTLERAHL